MRMVELLSSRLILKPALISLQFIALIGAFVRHGLHQGNENEPIDASWGLTYCMFAGILCRQSYSTVMEIIEAVRAADPPQPLLEEVQLIADPQEAQRI